MPSIPSEYERQKAVDSTVLWFHNYSAVGNSLGLTATVAALPIFFLFWALAYKRMKGYLAASLTLLLMLLVVVVAYGMPVRAAVSAAVLGMASGLWPTESVSLTFVTGTLSRIGGHLAAAAGRKPLPDGQGPCDSHLARARIDASIWSGFLVGAGLSGMAGSHFRMWALLPPCVVMIALGLSSECATSSPEKGLRFRSPGVRGAV